MLIQTVSLVGALFVLAAYLGLQIGWMKDRSRAYLFLNFLGAFLLFWIAVLEKQIGFVLLQAAWVGITIRSYLQIQKEKINGE